METGHLPVKPSPQAGPGVRPLKVELADVRTAELYRLSNGNLKIIFNLLCFDHLLSKLLSAYSVYANIFLSAYSVYAYDFLFAYSVLS